MTLNRFVIFATVARHRNITRAAEELHISQPSVTQQLKTLERDYQVRLYQRKGQGVELTQSGRKFLSAVRAILKSVDQLKKTFRLPPPRPSDYLHIGASHAPSASLVPSLITAFKKRHPGAEVVLHTGSSKRIEQMLGGSRVEIGIVTKPGNSAGLHREVYRPERMVAFVPSDHALARRRKLTFFDLGRTPLIFRWDNGHDGKIKGFLKELERQGLKPTLGMRCKSPAAVKAAVKRQMGVGVLFEDVIESDVRSGAFKRLRLPGWKLEGQSFIVYRRGQTLSPLAQEFLKLLRQRKARYAVNERSRSARGAS